MMLVDNLIHSDLHPGNILVRLNPPSGLLGVAYRVLERAQVGESRLLACVSWLFCCNFIIVPVPAFCVPRAASPDFP